MPGKKIAIYLDGTWNTPESRTNVFSLFEETLGERAGPEILQPFIPSWKKPFKSISKYFGGKEKERRWLYQQYQNMKNNERLRYYDAGVGTRFLNRVRGGAFGRGVSENILQAYEFLCNVWEPGDDIYVFGFSRGAYTARSLVGLLSLAGLMSSADCTDNKKRKAVMDYLHNYIKYLHSERQVYLNYRKNSLEKPQKPTWLNTLAENRQSIDVKFIGVWDTVGALGSPNRLKSLITDIFTKNVYETLGNTEVCENVEHAYHAMAIDEHRVDFQVTPWTYSPANTDKPPKLKSIEQCWFVGAHSNVGGGYEDNYLNEIPRHWMQSKAVTAGLEYHRLLEPRTGIVDEPIVDSYSEFAGGIHKKFHPPITRALSSHLEAKPDGVIHESIHTSVWQYYQNNVVYRPKNIPHQEIAANINNDSHDIA